MYHQYCWAELTWGASGLCTKIQEGEIKYINTVVIGFCTLSAGEAVVEVGWVTGWIWPLSHTAAVNFSSSFSGCVFLVSEGLRGQWRLQNPSGYCPQISR